MQSDLKDIAASMPEDESETTLVELGTWVGERKGFVAAVTLAALTVSAAVAFMLPVYYTSHVTLLAPISQQGSGSGALAALAATGVLGAGLSAKAPDELYGGLLRSDTVLHALDDRFQLQKRYGVTTFERLRKKSAEYLSVMVDKKTGLITLEVDDEEPKFAAELANAHIGEIQKLLGRLAVSEAQLRRVFFERQLNTTKENLAKAEQTLRLVQERSGVIVLDKQAEALIGGAAQIRSLIAEREVQLKVLRASATERNPDVMRLSSEIRALRGELSRMESSKGGVEGSAVDLPVGRIPEASIEYIRARRELKLQETLLEGLIRQFEGARLDEAKEGQSLQVVEQAQPADYKSKPARGLIVAGGTLIGLLASSLWVVVRRYAQERRDDDPELNRAWRGFRGAWGLRNR